MSEQNGDGTIGAGLDVPSSRGFAGGEPNKSSPAIEGMAKEKVAKELEAKKLLQLDGDRNSKVADLWKPDAPTAGSGTTDTKQADKNVGFAQVPYQYTLYTDDSQALMQLAAIAGRYRGELAGPNDSALELEELVGTEAATVIVKIPAHALQDFGRAIEGLGNVYSSADNRVFAGDPVEVRVKVQLAAGKPGTENAEPKASRMKQADHEVDQAL